MKYLLLIGLLLSIPTLNQAQTYEELIGKSFDALDKEDLGGAEEYLKEAMRLEPANPHNYALLTNLGTIQWQRGNLEEAITSYTAALSRNMHSIPILESRATVYSLLGETQKAINDYSTILDQEPNRTEYLYNRGLLYLEQQEFLSAEQDFDRILEINDKTINGRLGHAVLEKARGNYDESERIYNYLIGEAPKYWLLYESRADLYFRMGKNGRAMADVNRVFNETEPTTELYVLRGKIKLAQYEKEAARKDFNKAIEMGYSKAKVEELMKLAK